MQTFTILPHGVGSFLCLDFGNVLNVAINIDYSKIFDVVDFSIQTAYLGRGSTVLCSIGNKFFKLCNNKLCKVETLKSSLCKNTAMMPCFSKGLKSLMSKGLRGLINLLLANSNKPLKCVIVPLKKCDE